MSSNAMLNAALSYTKQGWPVFPLHSPTFLSNSEVKCSCGNPSCTNIGKHPRVKGGCNAATTDETKIKSWWKKWPDANIGLQTGYSFIVLDVDPRHGGDETLAELERKNGELPVTIAVETGGGGIHYYFISCPIPTKCSLLPGLDLKATGGFVVAPPSLHASGNQYNWLIDQRPGEIPLVEIPEWLLELIKVSSKKQSIQSVPEMIPNGKRNDTLCSMAGHMRRKGFSPEAIESALHEENKLRCNPPLPKDEVRNIAISIGRYTPEDPIKIQPSDDPIVFPDIMSGLAGDFARIYAEHLESPAHFFFMSFLTCLGSCLADRVTLASEIQQQPRLYTLILGESADDRKSTAISKTTDFFRESIIGFFDICYGVGSAEGLQKRFMDIKNRIDEQRLKESLHLLLYFDELKQFISKCRIESSVLLPCVNTLFENNRYESRTKTTDISLENVYLSILAASTVQTYERTWDSSFTDIGFNNRLFLVPGRGSRKFSIPQKIPKDKINSLKKRLGEILHHVGNGLELSITPSASVLYHEWYKNQEASIHSKRLDTYALRFMILLTVNELKNEIDEGIVSKAIALADWQLRVRQLYDPIDAENNIAKMEEKIRRVLLKGVKTERELKQTTNANRAGLWVFDKAKSNLQSAGEIIWLQTEKKWKLNEKV